MKISTEHRLVETALQKLESQVIAAGGYIDPNLIVECEKGNFRVTGACAAEAKKPILAIPEAALLPTDDMELFLAGDDLCVKDPGKKLSRERVEIAEAVLTLYNETGKIRQHKESCVWVQLASDLGLLEKIVAGRKDAPAIQEFIGLIKKGMKEKLVIKSFLKTRTLNFNTPDKNFLSIMPILDFVNHSIKAPGYIRRKQENGSEFVGVAESHIAENQLECFVRYGTYDSYDTWLIYGFVDEQVPFVRSVPLEIDLGKTGVITVRSIIGARHPEKLPAKLDDLRPFMPRILDAGKNALAVTHLIIPPEIRPHALRRVLAELISALSPGISEDERMSRVRQAEATVIEKNVEFYRRMKAFLENGRKEMAGKQWFGDAGALADLQLSKLEAYKPLRDEGGVWI